jgi:hypothetical protein
MTIDEYIDYSFQVLKANLDANRRYLTAARFGVLLRRANGDTDWKSLGFPTLASFLRVLESRGLITAGPNEKEALSVWVKEESPKLRAATQSKAYNPLRKSVWSAFVIDSPAGKRFLNRQDGAVRIGVATAPSPVDEWAEIVPIPQEEQQKWAREYLRNNKLESKVTQEALESYSWYSRLAAALNAIDSNAAKQWNRCRSLKISSMVESWCQKHSVQNSLVFQSESKRPETQNPVEQNTLSSDQNRFRAAVLAALAELPTENLLEISIPAKYLLRAFQSQPSQPPVR